MILTTNEFLTKVASVKVGKSCRIKKINSKNRTIAIIQPKVMFITPLSLGDVEPCEKVNKR